MPARKPYQYYFTQCRRNALIRNLPYEITKEYALDLLERQENLCPLSGVEIVLYEMTKDCKKNTASLDRIDAKLGYLPGNLAWVYQPLNLIRWNFELSIFLGYCRAVANFDGVFPEFKRKLVEANHCCFRGYKEIGGYHLGKIRHVAKCKKLELTIRPEHIWEAYVAQGGLCALSGLQIHFEPRRLLVNTQTASVDRVDASIGYVPGNIQIMHKHVNKMKREYPGPKFRELCGLVTAHQDQNSWNTGNARASWPRSSGEVPPYKLAG